MGKNHKSQRFGPWRFWSCCVPGRLLLRALGLWLLSFLLLWFTNVYSWSNICLVLCSDFLLPSLHHCFQSDSISSDKLNLKCWQIFSSQLKIWFIWCFAASRKAICFPDIMRKLLWIYEKAKINLWLLNTSISKTLCNHEIFLLLCLGRSLNENPGLFRTWHTQNLALPDSAVFSCTQTDPVQQALSVTPLQRHYLFIAFKSLAEISNNCLYFCCEFQPKCFTHFPGRSKDNTLLYGLTLQSTSPELLSSFFLAHQYFNVQL